MSYYTVSFCPITSSFLLFFLLLPFFSSIVPPTFGYSAFCISQRGDDITMARTTIVKLVPLTLLPFACISLLLMITTASNYVTCDTVVVDANAFACPDPGCEFVATIPGGTAVVINCTTSGVDVDGDYQWDYVGLQGDNTLIGYVSDLYVDCGGGACIAPSC
jgi:hypothetical protein